MVEYTIEQHVKNLKEMLKAENPCRFCPSQLKFFAPWIEHKNNCKVCNDFIGLYAWFYFKRIFPCPCHRLGKEEAIKRTLIAIEEYENEKKVHN